MGLYRGDLILRSSQGSGLGHGDSRWCMMSIRGTDSNEDCGDYS